MKFAVCNVEFTNYTCYFSHSCQVSKIILGNGDLVWMKAVCCLKKSQKVVLRFFAVQLIELQSYVGIM